MTQKEILDFNKRCAEFLGWQLQPVTALHNFREGSWKDKKWNYHFDLRFHSDWNWLTEVIKKLDNLAEDKLIEWSDQYVDLCEQLDETVVRNYNLQETVEVVNKFLIWYNENK